MSTGKVLRGFLGVHSGLIRCIAYRLPLLADTDCLRPINGASGAGSQLSIAVSAGPGRRWLWWPGIRVP